MSILLFVLCFYAAIAAPAVLTYWLVRKLHMSRYPDRVDLYFVAIAMNFLWVVLVYDMLKGLLR